MSLENYLTINLEIKDNSLYYHGTIYQAYNAFLVISNREFQITYGFFQREPLGKFSGAIKLQLVKTENEFVLIVKDSVGKEVYREKIKPTKTS